MVLTDRGWTGTETHPGRHSRRGLRRPAVRRGAVAAAVAVVSLPVGVGIAHASTVVRAVRDHRHVVGDAYRRVDVRSGVQVNAAGAYRSWTRYSCYTRPSTVARWRLHPCSYRGNAQYLVHVDRRNHGLDILDTRTASRTASTGRIVLTGHWYTGHDRVVTNTVPVKIGIGGHWYTPHFSTGDHDLWLSAPTSPRTASAVGGQRLACRNPRPRPGARARRG